MCRRPVKRCVAEIPVTSAFPLLFSAVVFPMTGLAGGLPGFARFAAASTLEAATASVDHTGSVWWSRPGMLQVLPTA